MRKSGMRFISALLALCMAFSLFPVSAFADNTGGGGSTTQQAAQADLDEENGSSTGAKTYLVAQKADHDHNIYTIAEAVDAINKDTASDDNIIQLMEDITLKTTLYFYNNTTILGENHSITTGKYGFRIGDLNHTDRKITFNLGQEGYSKTLTIKDGQPIFDLFEAQWCSADLNFYSGVTVDNINLDDRSVVILDPLNGSSMSFTMYGDSKITNCTSKREIVSLSGNNTMTMKDTSSISHCTATYATVNVDGGYRKPTLGTLIMEDSSLIDDCTISNSGNQCGGGVYLFGGVLTMNGNSKISNCRANGSGGVYCWAGTLTMNDNSQISDCSAKRGGGITICPDSINGHTASVQLNSGAIVNNNADFGGGIYVYARPRSSNLRTNWSWTGTTVCNNTAASAGSDIYADTKTNIALPDAVQMNLAGAKGPAIDGWYPDAADARYDLTKHTEPFDRTSIADPLTSDVALVASHVVYGIEFTGAYAENCTAYNSAGKQITAAAANETVYLKYQDTDMQLNGWSVKNGDDSVAVGSAAALGSDYFVMPEKPVDNKVTVTPVLNYKVTVTGGKDYNSEGNQIAYAEPGDEVTIKANAPAATAPDADSPDTVFANWETDNDLTINGEATGSKVNGSAEHELTFTMPSDPVSVTAVNQYKITIKGGKKYGDTAENEDGTYYYYAKAGDTVQLAFAGANGSHWSWNTAELPDGVTDAADGAPAHFTMPANAVTIEASAESTPVIPRAYRVQVQLPADVAFAEDAAPVTVSVPDTTGTDENPKPDRTSTTALGAEPEQLVTLKFDATTLPEGYTFGQWVVTQLLPEQTTVEVTAVSDLEATFSMPASPVTVTFTVNAPVEPEPDPEPSGDGGAGTVIAGALIGGTAYLLGTRAWLEGTYGYVPANRMELALGLWKRANCPAPVSTELYADIGQNDADAQAAARWCVEQGLLKDYHEQNDDGTETVTFKPGRYVARPYALTRWYQLEKLLDEQQAAQAETPAEAPAQISET